MSARTERERHDNFGSSRTSLQYSVERNTSGFPADIARDISWGRHKLWRFNPSALTKSARIRTNGQALSSSNLAVVKPEGPDTLAIHSRCGNTKGITFSMDKEGESLAEGEEEGGLDPECERWLSNSPESRRELTAFLRRARSERFSATGDKRSSHKLPRVAGIKLLGAAVSDRFMIENNTKFRDQKKIKVKDKEVTVYSGCQDRGGQEVSRGQVYVLRHHTD
ncbi:hypothetical protein F5890DRAFT_1471734 [Lentinula detonsa]|uniref:Uncharacterized protein n=1 Tax=Lentinula detonsa TaxID=2804962 RepID=A0AA38Q7B2_9AGAR|nr:hypothetical protein F5890DRAFT_1471734 [Lentinula detonsa]